MYNILICDDERDIVSALKIYLEAEGYTTFAAYNGREALDMLPHDYEYQVTVEATDHSAGVRAKICKVCGANGGEETFDRSYPVMWEGEFRHFLEQVDKKDLEGCYAELETSLLVSRVQTEARIGAGVHFPTD